MVNDLSSEQDPKPLVSLNVYNISDVQSDFNIISCILYRDFHISIRWYTFPRESESTIIMVNGMQSPLKFSMFQWKIINFQKYKF